MPDPLDQGKPTQLTTRAQLEPPAGSLEVSGSAYPDPERATQTEAEYYIRELQKMTAQMANAHVQFQRRLRIMSVSYASGFALAAASIGVVAFLAMRTTLCP